MLKDNSIEIIYNNLIDYIQNDVTTHNLSIKIYNVLHKIKSEVIINKIDFYDDDTFSVVYTYTNNRGKPTKGLLFKDLKFKNV